MNFGDLIGLGKKNERSYAEIQEDVAHALEEGMVELSESDFDLGERPQAEASADEPVEAGQSRDAEGTDAAPGEPLSRLTTHTRNRLAALDTFERFFGSAGEHLQQIAARMTEVKTLHGSIGEVITILHSEIHRGNDLELANQAMLAEHRKLWEQFQESSRQHQDRETLLERLQQRETMLMQDNESLRSTLSTAKLELVEATNTATKNETELEELRKIAAARAAEIERRVRENDSLRDKNIALSIELDKAQKREAELGHRLDEITKIHDNEAQRNADLLNALAKSEKEALKLQSALDTARLKHSETKENLRVLESEREAETNRSRAEAKGLRAEIQALQGRLQAAADQHAAMTGEVAEIKTRLSDAEAEKHVTHERLAALVKESEADKKKLTAAAATISEMTLRQASEQIQLDVRIQECEDLKAEIAELNAQIKELLPYERLHRVTQARQNAGSVVDFATVTAAAATKRNRRPHHHHDDKRG